jgi:hypothetical protein
MTKRLTLILIVVLAAAGAETALACPPMWGVVPSHSYGTGEDQIQDLAVVSETSAWNAGTSDAGGFVQKWDGTSWKTRLAPVATDNYYAIGVVAGNVWVGGEHFHAPSGEFRSRIRRWNGSSWSVSPTPNPPGSLTRIQAIAAISTADVWAVGSYAAPGGGWRPLLLHWDGTSWTRTAPPAGVTGDLSGVWAHGGSDVWAVGRSGASTSLAMHHDGTGWTVYPSANPEEFNVLLDVTRSPDGLWNAVGYGETEPDPQVPINLVLGGPPWTWGNGSPPASTGVFNGVASLGFADIWAAGSVNTAPGISRTLVKRWTSSGWATFPTPNLTGEIEGLNGVRRTPDGNLWAFGHRRAHLATLTERLCPIKVRDDGFEPVRAKVPQGSTVAWSFPTNNSAPHTFSDSSGMLLFNAVRDPGDGFQFRFSAAGSYATSSNVSGATGQIAVPVEAARDGNTNQIEVVWAASELGAGFSEDVQVRRNAGPWTDWLVETPDSLGVYTAPGPGTYRFRARLVRPAASGSTSGWSPIDSVVIP